jgi:hypothetical protein
VFKLKSNFMKTIRIMLGIFALTLAFGFAMIPELTTQSSVVDGYEYIPNGAGGFPQCKRWQDACETTGDIPCTISGAVGTLRQHNNPNVTPACGQDLSMFSTR